MPAKSFAFKGQSSPTAVGGYNLGAQSVWTDGVITPAGRVNANGGTQIAIYEMGAFVAGRGAPISVVFRAGAAASGAVGVGAAGSASSQVGVSMPTIGYYGAGSSIRVQLDCSGDAYIGVAGSGGSSVDSTTGLFASNATLAGVCVYIESPSAPLSPVATPDSTTQVTVTWAAPADNGGQILGYRFEYSTDPTFATGVTASNEGTTSKTIAGLTPGNTYYFRVAAYNICTQFYGTWSVFSTVVSASLGSAPGAPTGLTLTPGPGSLIAASWTAPASTGGSPILDYTLDYATNNTFTTGLVTIPNVNDLAKTIADLAPGTLLYFRVKARNAIGTSAASATVSATVPARTYLDIVDGASVVLSNGTQVSLRSDGAANPTITLGYSKITDGTTWTAIATIPDGAGSTDFAVPGGIGGLALVADDNGDLYVIGRQGSSVSSVLAKRFARTGSTDAWTPGASLAQALPNTGDPLVDFAAAFAGGATPSILVLARRAGTLAFGGLSYATLSIAALEAGAGGLFLASGSDPTWLPTPPAGATPNSGLLDITPLTVGATRLAIAANGFAVVDVSAGIVGSVSKAPGGSSYTGGKLRVVPVGASTYAVLSIVSGALSIKFYSTGGSLLGSATIAAALAWTGAFSDQWDAIYNPVTGTVRVFYIPVDSARWVAYRDVSASAFTVSAASVVTSTLGAASSVNDALRVPRGIADERRVLIEVANLLTGVHSLATVNSTAGNVAPSAPALTTRAGFDATQTALFQWTPGDSNPLDAQTAFQLQIQRVSDSVDVHDTGKVVSGTPSRTLAAAVLTNGVAYRWRVRTYDALDTVGAWSSYGTFTTTAAGTLTITDPALDNAPLNTASKLISWNYTNTSGATQVSYRLKVIRVSDAAVLSDTGVVTSTATSLLVSGLATGVQVRIELVIVNTGAVSSPLATRLITPDYGSPMTPAVVLTVTESGVLVAASSVAPIGDRPETINFEVYRRPLGDTAWTRIAVVPAVARAGSYLDRAVRSGRGYEYQVKGVS